MGDNSMNNNNPDNNDVISLVGIKGGSADISTSKKISILNQLQPQVREELSKHVWEIISYNPPKFLVAHSAYKQIVFATLKEENIKRLNNIENALENKINETIYSLNFSRIVIGAIPIEVTLNKNPLGLFDHKYTIKFATQSNDSFTIGPKTIDEIITYLKDRSLIYLSTKATEALSIMIGAFERNGQLIVKNDVDTPGFYFIDGRIRQYNNNLNTSHPKPTLSQIEKCCELLEILQTKFKKKDIFPTLLKWSIVAPFDYILKQVHRKWIPWLYPYGWSNTGKTTLGDICCCIWNCYQNKDSTILPFTAVDTKARLGEVLSKSTYPIIINEVGQLNDDRYRDMVEMIKTAITDPIARKKFVNKTIYTDIPSFSPCILTGNPAPPYDTGFRRRVIPIIFTEKDQYSHEEINSFENLFDKRIKNELQILGDFTVNYVMENQEILIDGKIDWKEIGEHILEQMFNSVGKKAPEWIKFFVEEHQLEESKEDIELLFRGYLINRINETYNKYYRNIEKIVTTNSDSSTEVPNLPFSDRLRFCLEHHLIPFLNTATIDGKIMIVITSDIIHDIKNKIPSISSLNEIARMIDGFEYGQKKIGGRNVRTAFGTKNQFLDFLWME